MKPPWQHPYVKKIIASPALWPAGATAFLATCRGDSQVTVKREGFRISAGTGRGQGLWCAMAGSAYEPELPWLLEYLQPGDTFIDVGANIGIFSLHIARRLGPAGQVFSLEPGPGAFQLLKRNILDNHLEKSVKFFQLAASNQGGTMKMGGDSAVWNSLSLSNSPSEGGTEVRITTLDDLLQEEGDRPVHALKIDAEGVEQLVLEGSKKLIHAHKPTIIFETISTSADNRAGDLLKEWGYQILAPLDDSPNSIALHPSNPRSKDRLRP